MVQQSIPADVTQLLGVIAGSGGTGRLHELGIDIRYLEGQSPSQRIKDRAQGVFGIAPQVLEDGNATVLQAHGPGVFHAMAEFLGRDAWRANVDASPDDQLPHLLDTLLGLPEHTVEEPPGIINRHW